MVNTSARAAKYLSPGYRRFQVYRDNRYKKYIKETALSEEELDFQRRTDFSYKPFFSILVPLYETDEKYLKELIDSVKAQTYIRWELCMSDGSGDKERLANILKPYMEEDDRIRLINDQPGPLGISSNTNQAYKIMSGDFLVLGDHDDLFAPDALFECAKALNADKAIDVIYTDEDKTDSRGEDRFEPAYKPEFNIDAIGSCNYITHMFVVRKNLVDKVGLLKDEFNGAQDYDFILRCTEQAEKIYHLAKPVYSWRINETSTAGNASNKTYAYEAGTKALQQHYDRLGLPVKVEQGEFPGFYNPVYDLSDNPLLSVFLLPPKMEKEDKELEKYLMDYAEKSITETATYENIEVIRLTYPPRDEEGNGHRPSRTKLVNDYISEASGEYVMFMDSRAFLKYETALEDMLGIIHGREDVGAVGPKIFDGNGYFRHAGIILGKKNMPHGEFLLNEKNDNTLTKYKDYSALREYVFLTKKSLFNELGGFDMEYSNYSYSILDYCLKLGAAGKLSVYNGTSLFGYSTNGEKKKRYSSDVRSIRRDRVKINEKWKGILKGGDKYYPADKYTEK